MLGSSLCILYHAKHQVFAFHRDEKCYVDCFADYSVDLTEARKVEEQFNNLDPDIVIHCAGLTNVDLCEKEPEEAYLSNVTATENVARYCPDKTMLVYISSDQVYGESKFRSEESVDLHPVNQYGQTKLQGEEMVREVSSNYMIIRTNIFGWNVKLGNISSAEWIFHSLEKCKEITLFTNYIFSPIFSEYLGGVILQLFEKNFQGTVNVGSPTSCSKYEFGITLARIFNFDVSLISAGNILSHKFFAPRPAELSLNLSKISDLVTNLPTYEMSLMKFFKDKRSKIDQKIH